jgi:multiple sugar transport system ATP-binding protein
MDEPLSNLDAKLRVQMRAEIARLQRALGITTIYVTHDQTEAMTLGTRVAVLSRGVLQQVAPPQELYRRPANLFVAGFIGSPAMNLLDARLERGDGGADAVFGSHRLRVPDSVLQENPALEQYLGRKVILGLRPENLEDASLLHDPDPESVIELPVELREELGSEVHVHCAVGDRPESTVSSEPADAGGSAAGTDVAGLAEVPHAAEAAEALRRVLLVARMDPRTTVREGEAAKIAVNLAALHFFDPDTGERIGG